MGIMSKTKETNLSEENVSLDENKTNEELRLLKSKVVDDQILNLKLFIKNLEKARKDEKILLKRELKEIAALKGKKKSKDGKPRKPSGIIAPSLIPLVFKSEPWNFEEEELPRIEVTKRIWAYCKENDLCSSENKKIIIPNDRIKELFKNSLNEGEQLFFTQMQKHIKFVYDEDKKKRNEELEEISLIEEPPKKVKSKKGKKSETVVKV